MVTGLHHDPHLIIINRIDIAMGRLLLTAMLKHRLYLGSVKLTLVRFHVRSIPSPLSITEVQKRSGVSETIG
jgi:hypothetical protein